MFLAVENMFSYFETHAQDTRFLLCATFLEVYNDTVYDLLDDNTSEPVSALPLPIREKNGMFFAAGQREIFITSAEEALDLLQQGNLRKVMGSSYLHDSSSRSHTVLAPFLLQFI